MYKESSGEGEKVLMAEKKSFPVSPGLIFSSSFFSCLAGTVGVQGEFW